jgi:hypothetical protein
MTVALHGAGIKTKNLHHCVHCWHGHTAPAHILRAQELANALAKQSALIGGSIKVKKMKGSMNDNLAQFTNKKGIIFI